MWRDKRIVVVMRAYNAARTLERTYEEVMAQGIVDRVIVVGDASSLGFGGSVRYGVNCLRTAVQYRLARWGLLRSRLFPNGDR